jgi:hypothetical protein
MQTWDCEPLLLSLVNSDIHIIYLLEMLVL